MIGAIIGDIVGSIYEFHNIKTKNFEFWSDKAFFTDDTVMTCAVYLALQEYKKNSSLDLHELLVKQMQRLGRMYPYPDYSYGGGFVQWIYSNAPKPYGSYGNGSAMRVSAAGTLADSLDEALYYAKCSAEVTHDHPYGIAGAVSIAEGIFLARSGADKKIIKRSLSKTWNLDFSLDEIREGYTFDETCQGTVPPAIVAFLEAENFEDAIRNAISLGGDSDTLAAITGSLADAYYGVPQQMQDRAYRYLDDYLFNICKDFISFDLK